MKQGLQVPPPLSSAVVNATLQDPAGLARDVAQVTTSLVGSVAALGAPGTDTQQLSKQIWDQNLKLLSQIAALYRLELPKLEFPYEP